MARRRKTLKQKLEENTKKGEKPGDCWEWIGGKFPSGYGSVWNGKKSRGAHRIAYELAKGPIPDDMFVIHSCDNPSCVNPDHLRVGTPADNMADKTERGRGNVPKGSSHGMSKLTETQVRKIRERYNMGNVLLQELAIQFGVTYQTISRIINRKNWTHI